MAVYERVSIGSLAQGAVPPGYTFTRSTAALYVDSDGLIKWAPHNLLPRSNEFSHSDWQKANLTATAASAVSPDGTSNAYKLEATATAATTFRCLQTAVASTYCTFSVYVKQGTGATTANNFLLRNFTTATTLLSGTLNYSTGVFSYVTGSSGVVIEDAGGGWWRVCMSVSSGMTSGDAMSGYVGFIGVSQTAGDHLYAYGAQLNIGSTATAYLPTTTAAVYGPRRQWDATNRRWGYVGEGSRTNLLTYSDDFRDTADAGDTRPWGYNTVTLTSNSVDAPDGATTGDVIVSGGGSSRNITRSLGTLAASVHTFSVWVKGATSTSVEFLILDNVSAFIACTGSVDGQGSVSGSAPVRVTGLSTTTWTRVVFTTNAAVANVAHSINVYPNTSGAQTLGDSVAIWGAQLEAAPAPSSYIPTTTVAVTRGADLLTRALTGPEGTALSTQGTMVVEFSFLGGDSTVLTAGRYAASIDGGSFNNIVTIYNRNGAAGAYVGSGGVSQGNYGTTGTIAVGVVTRQATVWKTNATDECRFVRDGGTVAKDSAGSTAPTVSAIGIGATSYSATPLFGLIYGWTIYDDAKTDAELQALTTPTTTRNQSRLTLGLGLGL